MIFQRRNKLLYKLLIFVIPFVVLSVVGTGILLSMTSYTFFERTINQNYRNILKSSAGEIQFFMGNARQNMDSLAQLIATLKLDAWKKEITLAAFLNKNPQFMSAAICDADGTQHIFSMAEEDAPDPCGSGLVQKAVSGKAAISLVMLTEKSIPYTEIAVPIFKLGKVDEILLARLNLKFVWDVLESIEIGSSGQVYVMDLSGRTIAHRKIDRVLRPPPAEHPEILDKLKSAHVPLEWEEQEDGKQIYCLGSYLPDLDWVVVLTQPYSEIYAYLYQNIFWTMGIIGIVCIMALLLGWDQVRRFLAPIHNLHRQVQTIGGGDMDHKVSVTTRDEIGDLGLAFNNMTDSLKEYIQKEIEGAKALVHAKNLAVLGTASSKVTHEVGNLLNNIELTLSALRKESLEPDGEKRLTALGKDSERVGAFIQNFLQFAKKPELRLTQAALSPIVREAMIIFEPEAEKKGIQIEFEWPEDAPPVRLDSRLMYQVVNNLIKNSLQAMTGPGKLSIRGNVDDKSLKVFFADTGPGMTEEVKNQIFDPFFTTKGKSGTGLGLPIVKTIVEAHRGTIECLSTPGEGTTFVLTFPVD